MKLSNFLASINLTIDELLAMPLTAQYNVFDQYAEVKDASSN